MRTVRTLLLLGFVFLITGCYATAIDTGRPRSTTVIRKAFASCWIFGLVPPATVETAQKCPNGVALVQTRLSFLNMLVGNITFGIYTPMEIVVTCAEESHGSLTGHESEIHLAKDASSEERRDAFGKAAEQAVKSGYGVLVRIDQ